MKNIPLLLFSSMLYTMPIVAMQKLNVTWHASIPAFSIESKGRCSIAIGKDETIMSFKKKTNDTILKGYKETVEGDREVLRNCIDESGTLVFQPQSLKTTNLRCGSFSQSFNDMGLASDQAIDVAYICRMGSGHKVYIIPKKNVPSLQQKNLSPWPFILRASSIFVSLIGLYFLYIDCKKGRKKNEQKGCTRKSSL